MYSWFQPIAEVLDPVLAFLYSLTHDWGIAVICLTLLVRSILMLFNIQTARQQVKQARIRPQLAELRNRFKNDPNRYLQESMKLNKEHGIKLLSFGMLAAPIIQMPILAGMIALFSSHGAAMTSMLVPWVATLAHSDPWHIVPLVYAILSFVGFMIPLTNELALAQSVLARISLPLLFSGFFSLMLWSSPIALGLYWTANAIAVLLERGFYRTPVGKALLYRGIHPRVEGSV